MLVLALITATALTLIGSLLGWFDVAVERQVLVTSHRYKEARRSELATWRADKARIEALLRRPDVDAATRSALEGQLAAIEVQLRSAEER